MLLPKNIENNWNENLSICRNEIMGCLAIAKFYKNIFYQLTWADESFKYRQIFCAQLFHFWKWIYFAKCIEKRCFAVLQIMSRISPFLKGAKSNLRSLKGFTMSVKKSTIHGLFFIYFCLFKKILQFLQQINVKKCPSSKRCWDSKSRPLEHESPRITTRPD